MVFTDVSVTQMKCGLYRFHSESRGDRVSRGQDRNDPNYFPCLVGSGTEVGVLLGREDPSRPSSNLRRLRAHTTTQSLADQIARLSDEERALLTELAPLFMDACEEMKQARPNAENVWNDIYTLLGEFAPNRQQTPALEVS
jgi:hypothetical protein